MTDPSTLLPRFKTAISNNDIEAAERIAERLRKTYEDRKSDRQRRLRQSLLVRDGFAASRDQQRTAREHVRTSAATELAWSSFLMTTATFLEYPEEIDKRKVQVTADELTSRESDLEESVTAVASIIDEADLPAAVDILAVQTPENPVLVGGKVELTIVIGNVGGEPARGVQLETQGDSGIEIDPPPASIGALDVETSSSYDFAIAGEEPGKYTLRFNLSAGNTESATERTLVNVYSEGAFASSRNGSTDQGPFSGVDSRDLPDWLLAVGAGGALGLGAGAYGYLKSDREGRNKESK